ncbi:MAG: hypothetical protein GXY83_03455 [Rhodopirellula sp.]|nr:hypothetical protein [Rhodopirellula sp.]
MIAKIQRRPRKPRRKRLTSDPSIGAFEAMLHQIRLYARASFRHLEREAREEAVQEATAHALLAYRRLVELGNVELAYPGALARHGVLRVKDGRKVGGHCSAQDLLSEHCQQKKNAVVERLDRFDEERGSWRQIAVEDRHAGPADVACLRIDFHDWLNLQPKRDQQVAESLAVGHTPREVAHRFSVSQARISQLRQALRQSWTIFQGEETAAAIT